MAIFLSKLKKKVGARPRLAVNLAGLEHNTASEETEASLMARNTAPR